MIHGLVVGVDHGVDVNLQQTGFLQTVDQFDGFNVETGVGDASQSHGPAAVLGFQQGMDLFFMSHRRNQGWGSVKVFREGIYPFRVVCEELRAEEGDA